MNTAHPSRIETIDTDQFGQPRSGAVYLLHGERAALVESGPASSVPRLLKRLEDEDLAFIFVTHVHLDHAGGAGALMVAHPEATVVVHPRGARHLIDPERLIAGARAASPHLFPLYGKPLPIPEDRIQTATDGDRFDLGGGIVLETIDAPGHAPHHLCFFEPAERILFAGDAVGNHGTPVDTPLTVPPRFDLERGFATLRKLGEMEPDRIAFTHYGIADGALALLEAYERRLVGWFERTGELLAEMPPDEVVRTILAEPRFASLSPTDRILVEMCVRGAILSSSADVS